MGHRGEHHCNLLQTPQGVHARGDRRGSGQGRQAGTGASPPLPGALFLRRSRPWKPGFCGKCFPAASPMLWPQAKNGGPALARAQCPGPICRTRPQGAPSRINSHAARGEQRKAQPVQSKSAQFACARSFKPTDLSPGARRLPNPRLIPQECSFLTPAYYPAFQLSLGCGFLRSFTRGSRNLR